MDPLDAKQVMEQVMAKISPPLENHPNLNTRIAIYISVFAFAASFSGIMANRCVTRGMVAKNEATFVQGQITDEWAYFQSRNVRIEMAQMFEAMKSKPVKNAELDLRIDRMVKERDESYIRAKDKEKVRDQWNRSSSDYLDISKFFASALVLLQVAVILIPLTLLVKKIAMLRLGAALGIFGIFYLIFSYTQYFRLLH